MSKIAFFTFGVLREADDHPEIQDFVDRGGPKNLWIGLCSTKRPSWRAGATACRHDLLPTMNHGKPRCLDGTTWNAFSRLPIPDSTRRI